MSIAFPHDLAKAARLSGQVLVVTGEDGYSFRVKAVLFAREDGQWRLVKGPMRAVAGRHGCAAAGLKHEGDGKTPSGLFPLTLVFGYEPSVSTKMPYRQATAEDVWVDDPESADYNRFLSIIGRLDPALDPIIIIAPGLF